MNDELIDAAELGEEARQFVMSPLGKALLDLAAQEVWIAQDEFLRANPKDSDKILELQNRAWRGLKFKEWMEEIIDKGDSAIAVFKDQEGRA